MQKLAFPLLGFMHTQHTIFSKYSVCHDHKFTKQSVKAFQINIKILRGMTNHFGGRLNLYWNFKFQNFCVPDRSWSQGGTQSNSPLSIQGWNPIQFSKSNG